jgi:hypothetical protein
MGRRPAPSVEATSSYAPVLPQASPVALEVAQGVAIGRAVEAAQAADADGTEPTRG